MLGGGKGHSMNHGTSSMSGVARLCYSIKSSAAAVRREKEKDDSTADLHHDLRNPYSVLQPEKFCFVVVKFCNRRII